MAASFAIAEEPARPTPESRAADQRHRGADRFDADSERAVRLLNRTQPDIPPSDLLPEEVLKLSVPEVILQAVEGHDELIAARKEVEAAREESREAMEDWFPQLDLDYAYGWEGQKKPDALDTSLPFHDASVEVTQLLWDFGAVHAGVEKARLELVEAEIELVEKRQELILETAEAYAQVIRAQKELAFARHSEENIIQQSNLQDELLRLESGLATDQLQAKRDLAGATASRYDAEGQLEEALNTFRRFFGTTPERINDLKPLAEPVRRMPADLGEALDRAMRNNSEIRLAAIQEAQARQDLRETERGEFFPKLEAVASRAYKENAAGTAGSKTETSLSLELSMPFNLGFTAINTLRANQAKLVAETRNLMNARREAEEDVRNAWVAWATARKTWRIRETQAEIAAEFLKLARTEQAEGNRSLQDVLSGETRLFNAQSDAATAQAEVVIEAFTLLEAMGDLHYDVIDAFSDVPLVPASVGANNDIRAIISPEVELLGSFGESALPPALAPNTPQADPAEGLTPIEELTPFDPAFDSVPDAIESDAREGETDPYFIDPVPVDEGTVAPDAGQPAEPSPQSRAPAPPVEVAPEPEATAASSPDPASPERAINASEEQRLQGLIQSIPLPARLL